jgi:response regulator containing cheY-like receiver domain and araC-type DNA-binding domain
MYQSMTNQVHTMQVQGLKQAAQETEKLYLNVPAIATRICNRYKLNKKSTDFLDVKTMMDLNRYALTDNPYIDSIYIYDPEKNTLIVDDHFADWNTFSDKDWLNSFYKHPKESPISSLWLKNRSMTNENDAFYYCSTYIQSFVPIQSQRTAFVVINLNLDRLYDHVLSSEIYGYTKVYNYYICLSNGQLIYGDNSKINDASLLTREDCPYIEIDGQKNLISRYETVDNQIFVCTYNERLLFEIINPTKMIYFIVFIVAFVVALLIGIFTSTRIYIPIRELFEHITHNQNEQNHHMSFTDAKQCLDDIFAQTEEIKTQLSESTATLNEVTIRKLLRSDITIDEKTKTDLFGVGIIQYAVLSVEEYSKNFTFDESNNLFALVQQSTEVFLPSCIDCFVASIDESLSCIVLFGQNGVLDDASVIPFCSDIAAFIASKGIPTCYIGIGNIVFDVNRLNQSFMQSLSALKYKLYNDNPFFARYSAIPKYAETSIGTFLSKYENKIINAIRDKNIDTLSTILYSMSDELKQTPVHPDIVLSWFAILRDILFGFPETIGYVKDEIFFRDSNILYAEFTQNKTIDHYIAYFIKICENLVLGFNAKDSQKHTILINDIKQYVLEHISEDISQSNIADIYGISTSYLSTMFKQESGQNFIKYVISVKMGHAMDLLAETDIKIKDIANEIGYYNDRSFYNTFKKYVGYTPSEYRTKFKRLK